MSLPLVFIVAVAKNGVIGGNNKLLWRLSGDLKRFKALTMSKPMVMGRKTFDSIGKPLPGRETIVVTRDAAWSREGVHVAKDLDHAVALGNEIGARMGASEITVVGGAEIYRQLLPRAARVEWTEVDLAPEGDALFGPLDPAEWQETARETHPRNLEAKDEADYAFVTYQRITNGLAPR
jgi:dihydrofolate reductase